MASCTSDPIATLPPAQEGEPHQRTFTLIGLHAGHVSLPRVKLVPLAPNADLSSETYLVNAVERVEILPVSGRATFIVGIGNQPAHSAPPLNGVSQKGRRQTAIET